MCVYFIIPDGVNSGYKRNGSQMVVMILEEKSFSTSNQNQGSMFKFQDEQGRFFGQFRTCYQGIFSSSFLKWKYNTSGFQCYF